MIQRKQTLFLIFVLLFFVPMFFMNLVTMEAFNLEANTDKIYSISVASVYPLTILASLITLIAAVTIFLYKKTSLQLRLSIINIVLIIGFICMEIYTLVKFYNAPFDATTTNITIGMASFFALPALVFSYLAFKGIAKDIFILRSFNRMR